MDSIPWVHHSREEASIDYDGGFVRLQVHLKFNTIIHLQQRRAAVPPYTQAEAGPHPSVCASCPRDILPCHVSRSPSPVGRPLCNRRSVRCLSLSCAPTEADHCTTTRNFCCSLRHEASESRRLNGRSPLAREHAVAAPPLDPPVEQHSQASAACIHN
jgi:hypothetical protein